MNWKKILLGSFFSIAAVFYFLYRCCLSTDVNRDGYMLVSLDHGDIFLNAEEIILARGYDVQMHEVQTDDSYILTMYRIVDRMDGAYRQRFSNERAPRVPIILQHGLLSSCVDWILASPSGGQVQDEGTGKMVPSNNLGFFLVDAGYDVWLSNTRGNSHSRQHRTRPRSESAFWKFSYDEMIKYDTPAIIDYVLNATKRDSLGWIGHSQGAKIMFGFLAEYPEQSHKIRPFIALAPVVQLKNAPASLKFIAQIPLLPRLLQWIPGEYRPSHSWILLAFFACSYGRNFWCRQIIYFLLGQRLEQLDTTRLVVYYTHYPDVTSRQNLVHHGQNLRDERFVKFDWGPSLNMYHYNSSESPNYELEKINNTCIALMYSSDDPLTSPSDMKNLKNRLKVQLLDDYSITHVP